MGNFSEEEHCCRVDIFKERGKWYTTLAVPFVGPWEGIPHDVLRESISQYVGNQYSGMIAVCLDPYVKHKFPLMIRLK